MAAGLAYIPPMRPIRLRPDVTETARLERRSLNRALCGIALAGSHDEHAADWVERTWRDPTATMMTRAAQSPADSQTGFPQWVSTSVLPALAPRSAALKLFGACLYLELAGQYAVKVPKLVTFPQPIFVGEGNASPVAQWDFGATTLGPVKKTLINAAVTGELDRATPDTASKVIGRVLGNATERSLDAYVLGAGAGDAATPPGLLHNVVPITASTNSSITAISSDIGAMVEAIANSNIDVADVIFVCAPRQAVTLRTLLPHFDAAVVPSIALPAGTVMAVAPQGVAWATDGAGPEIDSSKSTALHYDDSSPQTDLMTPPAVPTRSAFQTDLIVVKVRSALTWTTVAPGAVQVVADVNW
jgi:hypothetical protein